MTTRSGRHPRHLLSAGDLSRAEVEHLVAGARTARSRAGAAKDLVAGLLFFEESTRTRVGFEAAVAHLGGTAVAMTGTKYNPTMSAAESWPDTLRSIGDYFHVLCVRHPSAGAAAAAAGVVDVPVINCGNGADEHPTQALIDVLAMYDHFGKPPDGRRIAIVGDLRNMRAAHSLLLLLSQFHDVTVVAVRPEPLDAPARYREAFAASGNRYLTSRRLADVTDVDIVYVAGFAPGTPEGFFDAAARRPFQVNAALVRAMAPDVAVLCPLPRIDEIDTDVDELPQARYFDQSRNGLGMRMAVLERCLGRPQPD